MVSHKANKLFMHQAAYIPTFYSWFSLTWWDGHACWCKKQWQNFTQVLHNNRIKFPKDFFRYCSVHQHGHHDVTWKLRINLAWILIRWCSTHGNHAHCVWHTLMWFHSKSGPCCSKDGQCSPADKSLYNG